jgi:predicted DNA-binding transcriptional regulator AlpA
MELKFSNPQTELVYQDLKSRYNKATLTKKELANEFTVSTSTIDLYISKGIGIPNYKKLGTAKNAKVVFNIIDVAEYLSQTIKTA